MSAPGAEAVTPSTGEVLRQEAARRAATAGTGGSAPALESTLATISAEVTAEAIERMERTRKGL